MTMTQQNKPLAAAAAKPIQFKDAPLGVPFIYREKMDKGEYRESVVTRVEDEALQARFPAPFVPCRTTRRVQGDPTFYLRYDTGVYDVLWVTDGRIPVVPLDQAIHAILKTGGDAEAVQRAYAKVVDKADRTREHQISALAKLSDDEIKALGLYNLAKALSDQIAQARE